MVSAIHQHELAIGIHVSPPSGTTLPHPSPPPPSRLSQIPNWVPSAEMAGLLINYK